MTAKAIKPEFFVTNSDYLNLIREVLKRFQIQAGKHGWSALKSWNKLPATENVLFVIGNLQSIDRERLAVIRKLHNKNKYFLLFKEQVPVEGILDRIAYLGIRDNKRIHLVDTSRNGIQNYFERLFVAFDCEGNDNYLLDAWWEEDVFVVLSPTLEGFVRLRVPVEKINVLKNKSESILKNFKIDDDGLFIYWPDIDVHLGWEQFEQAINPAVSLKAKQKSTEFNRKYGGGIRTLRKETGLRQSDIAGLTTRQLSRIERGLCRATHAALSKLAKAHKRSLSDYLEQISKRL